MFGSLLSFQNPYNGILQDRYLLHVLLQVFATLHDLWPALPAAFHNQDRLSGKQMRKRYRRNAYRYRTPPANIPFIDDRSDD